MHDGKPVVPRLKRDSTATSFSTIHQGNAMGRSRRGKPGRDDRGVSFDTVREIARQLPGAVEGTSYGTPAFLVGKALFVRQHQDGMARAAK